MSLSSELASRVRDGVPVALATVVAGPGLSRKLLIVPDEDPAPSSLGDSELDRVVRRDALAELEAGRSGVRHYGSRGQTTPEDLDDSEVVTVFVESWAPPPQMWIFGAVDFTAALARVAKILGFRVLVCDAREIFATGRRFPMADEVRVTWPGPVFDDRGAELGSRDAVCILTHDPKFDVPAVLGALATRVGYIGVMGSRTTHLRRMERLTEAGVTDQADIDRLTMPVLFCHGDDDPYVDYRTSLAAVEAMPSTDTTIRVYEGARHELVNETNRDEIIDEIVAFVARLIDG